MHFAPQRPDEAAAHLDRSHAPNLPINPANGRTSLPQRRQSETIGGAGSITCGGR
jgi:hypothetical protein